MIFLSLRKYHYLLYYSLMIQNSKLSTKKQNKFLKYLIKKYKNFNL